VSRFFEFTLNSSTQLLNFLQRPYPNVRIEQKLHLRRLSKPANAPIGATISPITSKEPLIDPSRRFFLGVRGGTTSATACPNRVTRTGAPVRRTSSSTARQVALNFEIAISRIFKFLP